MSITFDANGRPLVTSLYDWETSCILPAILSGPLMMVGFDLAEDENGNLSITRKVEDATLEDHAEGMRYARAITRYVLRSSIAVLGNYLLPRRRSINRQLYTKRVHTCRERRTPPLVCLARLAR